MKESKKEESFHTKKQPMDTPKENIYNTLSEDAWEKRKIEVFATRI